MKLLMCAPRHYAIQYEINPWMKIQNRVQHGLAEAQWLQLYKTLQTLGADISLIPQKKSCPDMVFTANGGIVEGKTFIPSHFRYKQRRGEESAFIRFFREQGFTIRDAARGLYFEGEGDMLHYQDMLFGGFRYRSEIGALQSVSDSLGRRLVSLELSRPHFYHLDTCFLPLDDRSALYYPDAFDSYGRKAIQTFVQNPIAVSREDAYRFACNGLRLGHTVVLNQASRGLKSRLSKLGYKILESPTSEFMKGGGSVKCLLLTL